MRPTLLQLIDATVKEAFVSSECVVTARVFADRFTEVIGEIPDFKVKANSHGIYIFLDGDNGVLEVIARSDHLFSVVWRRHDLTYMEEINHATVEQAVTFAFRHLAPCA